jgi:hypothetical protein
MSHVMPRPESIMADRPAAASGPEDKPLLSGRAKRRILVIFAVLVLLTAALAAGGRWLGERMALGGHTESREMYRVAIGQDRLTLAANTIRFGEQRHSGRAERIDLYLAWPELAGYSKDIKARFDDASNPDSLLFLQLSQSTMSRDMSGRLEPIYSRLFDGKAEPGPFGLTLHRLKPNSGYGREVILTAPRDGSSPPYVVRCLLPAPGEPATSGDCQRDIRAGEDLTVLYRFSSTLLRDWQHIDAAVQSFVAARLVKDPSAPAQTTKMPPSG